MRADLWGRIRTLRFLFEGRVGDESGASASEVSWS